MDRRGKINYYLDIAETILERGTCLRKNYGSIIVKNDEIIATGYPGAPRGRINCSDLGYCLREKLEVYVKDMGFTGLDDEQIIDMLNIDPNLCSRDKILVLKPLQLYCQVSYNQLLQFPEYGQMVLRLDFQMTTPME